jgi:hypothetical protein
LALLGVVVPYELASRLAWLFFGVKVSPMGVWRAVQRLGEAAGRYSDALSDYHADSRSQDPITGAPEAVVLSVDGCMLGMQVRLRHRRRKTPNEQLPPLPKIDEGGFPLKQWCAIPWHRWINFPTLPHASEKIWLRAPIPGWKTWRFPCAKHLILRKPTTKYLAEIP